MIHAPRPDQGIPRSIRVVRHAARLAPPPVVDRITVYRHRHRNTLAGRLMARILAVAKPYISAGDDTIARGPGQGLRINVDGAITGYALGTVEPATQEVLHVLCQRNWVCYDVGASVGFFSLILGRLVGPTGKVVSFEPSPPALERLRHNVALNPDLPIAVLPLALSNQDGAAPFDARAELALGRLVSPSQPPGSATARQVAVQVRRLDTLVAERDLAPPDLIKIDVEGAEVDVFDGMERLLHAKRPLIVCSMHQNLAAMEHRLARAGYRYVLSTGHECLEAAPWNVDVVAAPEERATVLPPVAAIFRRH